MAGSAEFDFIPPLRTRTDKELFGIAVNTEDWQPFARAQAESILLTRGFEQDEIDNAKGRWQRARVIKEARHVEDMARRRTESYTNGEVLTILIGWPILVGIELAAHHLVDVTGKGLWTLSAEGRWLKFWQRCVLIPASLALYYFVLDRFLL